MARKHSHRDDLAGEHRVGDAGQAIIACLFFVVWIGDTLLLKSTTLLNDYVPLIVRIPLGIILIGLAGYLARKGLSIVFGETRETPGVIRKGVFNVVRHPIYLSEIVLYFGFILLSLSIASMVVWIMAFLFLHFISRFEEKLLLDRFGEEYEQYMREVPMWIPRLRNS